MHHWDLELKHDLLRAVSEVRAWAEQRLAHGKAIAEGYLDGTAPYTERAHIVTLTFSYRFTHLRARHRTGLTTLGLPASPSESCFSFR